MVIYKFTLLRGKAPETHYVQGENMEECKDALAKHLGIEAEKIRHNPKNVPYEVREKIRNKVTEILPNGNSYTYGLTLVLENKSKSKVNIRKIFPLSKEAEMKTQFEHFKKEIKTLFDEKAEVMKRLDIKVKELIQEAKEKNFLDKEYSDDVLVSDVLNHFDMTLVKGSKELY